MNNARTAVKTLVIEDEAGVRNLIGLALKHHGYLADFTEDAVDGLARLRQSGSRYAAIITNLRSAGNLPSLVEEARSLRPAVAVIGLADARTGEAERALADYVVVHPVNGEKLRTALNRCLAHLQQGEASEDGASASDYGEPSSVWRNEMQSLVRHVAAADVPVLVQGETGAGKEVLARQIHSLSPRARKPFLKVNCAALPSELIESELFGYERGAFTGAFKTTAGKFEMADGGSILLDEIGDMDFKLQAKLLQVLQDNEFIRLGSSEPRRVDVRVLAATHCDLEQAIAERRFREDLYYRLNIVTLCVPPLRDRKGEVLPLAYHFMRKHATAAMPAVEITPGLREVLLAHDWPGNIRELENVIRKLLVVRKPEYVADELRTRTRRRAPAPYVPAPAAAVPEPVVSLPRPAVAEKAEMPVRAAAAAAAGAGASYSAPLQMPSPAYRANGALHDEPMSPVTEMRPAPQAVLPPRPAPEQEPADNWSILDRVDRARREAETEAILQALGSTLWNRKRAAELLNIDYKALLYKMKKLGIAERAAKIAI